MPEEDLRSLFEAARWAASSYNEQPWSYIVATTASPEDFERLLSCLVEGNQASTYIAYSGPFHVDEEKQTLTHSMFVSLFPNWTGQTQPRVVKIDGDDLHLSTEAPIRSAGKMVMSYLRWRRAGEG